MKAITEKDGLQAEWHREARDMTMDKFPAFIEKLNGYRHDYGTCCHAIAAAAVAAAWAMNREPAACGGVTGFQAGAIMWEFMQHWGGVKAPAKLVDWNNLLYPQYDSEFGSISQDAWAEVQAEAKRLLEKSGDGPVSGKVIDRWRSVAAGVVPCGLVIREN